jgi:hypothetical protein
VREGRKKGGRERKKEQRENREKKEGGRKGGKKGGREREERRKKEKKGKEKRKERGLGLESPGNPMTGKHLDRMLSFHPDVCHHPTSCAQEWADMGNKEPLGEVKAVVVLWSCSWSCHGADSWGCDIFLGSQLGSGFKQVRLRSQG